MRGINSTKGRGNGARDTPPLQLGRQRREDRDGRAGHASFAQSAVAVLIAIYLDLQGFSLVQVGAFLTVGSVGAAVAAVVVGVLGDAVGRRRTLMTLSLLMALSGVMLVGSERSPRPSRCGLPRQSQRVRRGRGDGPARTGRVRHLRVAWTAHGFLCAVKHHRHRRRVPRGTRVRRADPAPAWTRTRCGRFLPPRVCRLHRSGRDHRTALQPSVPRSRAPERRAAVDEPIHPAVPGPDPHPGRALHRR